MSDSTKILIEIDKIIESENINDSKKILDILMKCVFSLSIKHHQDPIDFSEQKYAKIISQMIFTKLYNIRKNLDGVDFSNDDFSFKRNIIDTNLIANNVRNLFETICLFNNFFIQSNSENELRLKLNLWEYSSIKYRLKFKNIEPNPEQQDLIAKDEKRLQILKEGIKNSKIYKNLDEKNQGKINQLLKQKDYKFSIIDNQVEMYDWQTLGNKLPDNRKTIPLLYTILSFYSHPSWKSVYDYGNGFTDEKVWIQNTQDLLRYSYILSSVFIIDYIKYFPKSEKSFNELDEFDSHLIEFYNYLIRGKEYVLNKKLFDK